MGFSSPIISLVLHFLLLVTSVNSLKTSNQQLVSNQTYRPEYVKKMMIAARLQQINKPAVKTIQSPDGDIIDCILTHKQLAFDHPLLKGQKPLDPPEILKEYNQMSNFSDNFQLWSLSGESCPDGTIPVRRITEQELLRADSINGFGRKATNNKHQHVVAVVEGGGFHGAKANINVWAPQVESLNEFSLAQMWIASGSFQNNDVNSIEAGWEVYPKLYRDNRPRLFIYWTADSYHHTGCRNLECKGFVQTNKKVVLGGVLTPSTYDGQQFILPISIRRVPATGQWWLKVGTTDVGYWPSSIFTHLKDFAEEVHWGGEIVNSKFPQATSTQMGSGHLPNEGYKKAAYFRNIEVLDSNLQPVPLPENKYLLYAAKPNCYGIQVEHNQDWGKHFYFGGPGRSENCP